MLTRREILAGTGLAAAGSLAPLASTAQTAATDWPQFRGPQRDNISRETGLARKWPAAGPRVLWTVPVAQGYAGAAIVGGRVYHHDYDEAKGDWCLNCRNLADGKQIWQYRENREIRPNHAITRTVPSVDGRFVFSLDPKAVLHCVDVKTGKMVWRKSLVAEYKSTIPPWYNGQCPLMERDRVIIATGGGSLLVAMDKATGKDVWRTPNTNNHLMSHASVMPATLGGVRQYLYGSLKGLMGVSAGDGKLLWEFPRRFNVALAPSPVAIGNDRVFLTGSYDAGSVMVRLKKNGAAFEAEPVFDMKRNEWNSEVHTPIIHSGHLFAVGKKRRGLFTCLSPEGKEVWTSDGKASFGLGSYMMADGRFYVLEGDTGMLRMIEANTTGYNELASAQVLSGREVWGPMALSGGRMVLRDLTKMVCIDLRG
ncbi:MAG: PQQ-binding-like beta-propeller repeat protein [Bryobacteraceae bacterium]|nr:PQQ-binding-like beta-propeller repeat protein [Bryobacteraceae bacterium]